MLAQAVFILAIIAVGIPISYWTRRIDMSGFELWLPMAILISIGISPLVGFLVGLSIVVLSWFVFPFHLIGMMLMMVCLLIFCYMTNLFTFTEANLVKNVLIIVVGYNIVSNAILFPIWPNPMSIVKFFAFSTWLTWLITSQWGWKLVTWLGA